MGLGGLLKSQSSGLCTTLDMDFGEFHFPRTSVNRAYWGTATGRVQQGRKRRERGGGDGYEGDDGFAARRGSRGCGKPLTNA